MRSRLIAGIFSLLLVLLVIVGPVYLSEKLEVIETSGSDLKSFEEVRSESVTTWVNGSEVVGYSPYRELNNETAGYCSGYYGADYTGACWRSTAQDPEDLAEVTILSYNVNEYNDSLFYGGVSDSGIYFGVWIEIDINYMLENEIKYFYLSIDIGDTHRLKFKRMFFQGRNSDGTTASSIDSGYLEMNYVVGSWEYTFFLSDAQLNNYASTIGNTDYQTFFVEGQIEHISTGDNPTLYFDFEIAPNYFEEMEQIPLTNYENETITVYQPYIQSITPYSVHKVGMVAGGILILLVGLVASPLPIGEVFDGIFPINNHQKRRSNKKNKR